MGSTRNTSQVLLALIAGLVFAGASANAAPMSPSRFCRDIQSCVANGYLFQDLLNRRSEQSDIEILLPRLNAIANIMTDIWADTILEGNYDIDGLPYLERIEGVYQQGQLAGYRITYSARAWRLGPNGERAEEGRITESAFVTLSLAQFFRDEGAVAAFSQLSPRD